MSYNTLHPTLMCFLDELKDGSIHITKHRLTNTVYTDAIKTLSRVFEGNPLTSQIFLWKSKLSLKTTTKTNTSEYKKYIVEGQQQVEVLYYAFFTPDDEVFLSCLNLDKALNGELVVESVRRTNVSGSMLPLTYMFSDVLFIKWKEVHVPTIGQYNVARKLRTKATDYRLTVIKLNNKSWNNTMSVVTNELILDINPEEVKNDQSNRTT